MKLKATEKPNKNTICPLFPFFFPSLFRPAAASTMASVTMGIMVMGFLAHGDHFIPLAIHISSKNALEIVV